MCFDPVTVAATISSTIEAMSTAELLTAATAAVSAGSALVQYQSSSNQAEVASDMAKTEADERRSEGEMQRRQEYEQAASEVNAYQAQAMKERAAVDALLGEYGGGNTANRKLSTLGIQQGQDLATLASNASKKQTELSMSERADLYSIRSKAAATPRPSVLGTGLTIASAGLSYGRRMDEINNPKLRTSSTS